jgi:hypothetical protein
VTDSNHTVQADGVPIGIAPYGFATVAAGKEIPYKAIMPVNSAETLDVYYAGDADTHYGWPAEREMVVHTNMRLKTARLCWVW